MLACEGKGGSGGLVVRNEITVENCTPPPTLSFFPPGLALLSESLERAVVAQSDPNAIVTYDLRGERPATLAAHTLGVDSDGDLRDDAATIRPILGFPLYPVMGEVQAPDDSVVLASTSSYEQVLAFDPTTALPIPMGVSTPAALSDIDYPLLPAPGSRAVRNGLSTLACVYPTGAVDSTGSPVAVDPRCGATRPSFLTNLTAGKAIAAGRLFVATSNLALGARFLPGTVLVFDWNASAGTIEAQPSAATPVLYTSGFNATGVARFQTVEGRELVLVTVTGAIGTGTGQSNVLTESFVDVIDPTVPRIVATIPLGFAGPSFDAPAIDPTGRIAWLGASSSRQLYAVDLRPLDDPRLYQPDAPPLILDGQSIGGLDARIFTADRPFPLPPRSDGRSSAACEGLTDVTVNASGTEVFASDYCDGTITRIQLSLDDEPTIPFPESRFRVIAQENAFAPNDVVGELRAPSIVAARPGIPGVDYTSPDVLALVGQPEGQVCAIRIESR